MMKEQAEGVFLLR
uniref:Uncharacterized protein n=1 Tax=Arundo donax TaxID=35708 RepID=A0A0A8YLC8_ARUDO